MLKCIKFHLYLSDSCHQNMKKYVTWGLRSQKFYVYFVCNPMEPFISGVRPCGRTPLIRATMGFYAKLRVFKARFEGEAAIF